MNEVKSYLRQLIKDCFGITEAQLDANKFEMVPRPDAPLSMNDYLVDKKPPCRLLTLSESEKNKQRMYRNFMFILLYIECFLVDHN